MPALAGTSSSAGFARHDEMTCQPRLVRLLRVLGMTIVEIIPGCKMCAQRISFVPTMDIPFKTLPLSKKAFLLSKHFNEVLFMNRNNQLFYQYFSSMRVLFGLIIVFLMLSKKHATGFGWYEYFVLGISGTVWRANPGRCVKHRTTRGRYATVVSALDGTKWSHQHTGVPISASA